MSFVLDASVALAWGFDEPEADLALPVLRTLRSRRAWVPPIWFYETSNGLLVAERRKRVTAEWARALLDRFRALPLQVDSDGSAIAFSRLPEVARRYELSICDAGYLELALRRGLPLATLDGKLQKAAEVAGVTLFGG